MQQLFEFDDGSVEGMQTCMKMMSEHNIEYLIGSSGTSVIFFWHGLILPSFIDEYLGRRFCHLLHRQKLPEIDRAAKEFLVKLRAAE